MKQEKRIRKIANLRMVFNVVIVVALVAVVVILIVLNNHEEKIDESYFVSNDNKIIATMDKEIASYDNSEYEPPITRIVYYLAGEKVDNVKLFFEYENEEDAKVAFENITMEDKPWAANKKLNGKYIVFDFIKEQYDRLTAEQVRMFAD